MTYHDEREDDEVESKRGTRPLDDLTDQLAELIETDRSVDELYDAKVGILAVLLDELRANGYGTEVSEDDI